MKKPVQAIAAVIRNCNGYDAQPNAGNPNFAHRAPRFLFFLLFLFFFFFVFFVADRTRLT